VRGDLLGSVVGDVDDGDAAGRRGVDVDAVDADAVAAEDPEGGAGLEHRGVDRHHVHEQALGVADRSRDRAGRVDERAADRDAQLSGSCPLDRVVRVGRVDDHELHAEGLPDAVVGSPGAVPRSR